MSVDVEAVVAKYRKLHVQHEKALRKRDEWDAKAVEYGRKVESFRVVMDEMGIDPETAPVASGEVQSLRDAMLEAARELRQGITVETIQPLLPPVHQGKDAATYSSTLIRLWRVDGELQRDHEGRGGKHSVYSVVGADDDDADTDPLRLAVFGRNRS